MFLIKSGLTKEAFVATGVVIAVMVDVSRLLVYGHDMSVARGNIDWLLVSVACVAAFAGACFGVKLLRKVTIRFVQIMVSLMLVIVALGMMAGIF